jgi:hypothetical protein
VEVRLVPIGGDRVAIGFAGLVDGPLDVPGAREEALRKAHACGYLGAEPGFDSAAAGSGDPGGPTPGTDSAPGASGSGPAAGASDSASGAPASYPAADDGSGAVYRREGDTR